VTEDKLKKYNKQTKHDHEKSKQCKTQQNKTTLVQSPSTTVNQEMTRAIGLTVQHPGAHARQAMKSVVHYHTEMYLQLLTEAGWNHQQVALDNPAIHTPNNTPQNIRSQDRHHQGMWQTGSEENSTLVTSTKVTKNTWEDLAKLSRPQNSGKNCKKPVVNIR